MKNLFKIIGMLILLNGCSEDEAKSKTPTAMEGKWSLVNYRGGLAPTEKFNANDVVWNIDATHINVSINIKLNDNTRIPLTKNGKYEYKINTVSKKFTIVNMKYYDYSIKGDNLKIWQQVESDGPEISFVKKIK